MNDENVKPILLRNIDLLAAISALGAGFVALGSSYLVFNSAICQPDLQYQREVNKALTIRIDELNKNISALTLEVIKLDIKRTVREETQQETRQ